MTRLYDILKSRALRWLPDSWLAALKARHYYRMLQNFNVDDEPDMKIVPYLVQQGTIAVDLGANVGVYTKLLSRLVGASGNVLSAEPVPETFAILRENVRRFQLQNVTLFDAAVSDVIGTAMMVVPEYPSGGFNFYESQIVHGDAGSVTAASRHVTVRTTTLDAMLADRSPVCFIKCDVEGHEGAVLAGATSILRNQFPAWLIEISENPDTVGTSAFVLFERLAQQGYVPWFFDGRGLRTRRRGDRSTNYFFLMAEHVLRVRSMAPALIPD